MQMMGGGKSIVDVWSTGVRIQGNRHDTKDRQDRMRIIITNDTQTRVHFVETCMCKQSHITDAS